MQPRETRHTLVRGRRNSACLALLLAGILALTGRHASVSQSLPAPPTESEKDVAIGTAALAQGDNVRAEAAFREALSRNSTSIPLLNDLALSLARQNRSEEAIGLYHQALALKPGDAVTQRNLGVAYFRAHRFAEAQPLLVSVAKDAGNFQSLELAGLDLFALDRYAEAVAYLKQAQALEPDNLENLHMLGQAYLRLKNYVAVSEIFTHIMAIQPDSAEAHVMLATAYDKLFREQEAISELEAAERIDPHYSGVHTSLGVIFWRLEETTLARQQFSLALQQSPTDPIANCTMGRILRREGKLHEAIPYFEAALAANKEYGDALREIGQSWAGLQEPVKAIAYLQRAEALEPADAETHFILGTVLRETGRVVEGNQERAKAAKILSEQHTRSSSGSGNSPAP